MADSAIRKHGKRWRPKALDTTPDDSREWLIWSMYHNCWHRRSSTGGAAGYSNTISGAGLFETKKAREYHDGVRNRAIHISKQKAKIIAAHKAMLDRHARELDEFTDMIAKAIS
jgi:hypothetical protein